MKTQELVELGLVKGTCVRINYSTMEMYGICHYLNNGKLYLLESILTKSNINREEKLPNPSLQIGNAQYIDLIISIQIIAPNDYKDIIKEAGCDISKSNVNQYITSQYLLQNCVMVMGRVVR